MSGRESKLLLVVVPLLALAAYWFLILGPKREEAARAGEDLARAEQRLDAAKSKLQTLEAAKKGFKRDYGSVVRLGRAIPSSVDMPGLLEQLDKAAQGTGIEFDKVATGDRAADAQSASGGQPQPGGGGGNAAGGGTAPQPGSGSAGSGSANAGNASSGTSQGPNAAGANGGKQPPAGGGPAAGGKGAALDSVPLDFSFTGSFFDLANFFDELKQFVRVTNERIVVRGRLMTIDSFTFTSGESFPELKAEVKASVYLVPKQEGVTGGATPTGPGTTSASNTAAPNPPAASLSR